MLGGDKQRPVFFCQVTKSQRLEYYLIQKLLQIYQSLALFWSPNLINCFFSASFPARPWPKLLPLFGPIVPLSSSPRKLHPTALWSRRTEKLSVEHYFFIFFWTYSILKPILTFRNPEEIGPTRCSWNERSHGSLLPLGSYFWKHQAATGRFCHCKVGRNVCGWSLVLILCDNMMFLPHQIQNGSNVHPFGKNRVRFCLGWPKAICTWVWKFRCTNPTKKLDGPGNFQANKIHAPLFPGLMCSGKLKPMYFGQEIPKLPEYMVWVCNPVLDPWHFTWVFKNHGTKFRPENKNRTSNPGHQTKTGHRIPAIRPKPDIKSRPSDQQSFPPRTLDAELRAHSKASEPGWDWQKLSFVLELKSAVQDEELSKHKARSTLLCSQVCRQDFPFLRPTSKMINCSIDATCSQVAVTKQRPVLQLWPAWRPWPLRKVLIPTLVLGLMFGLDRHHTPSDCWYYCLSTPVQKMHAVAWKLVNGVITEICPTWCNGLPNKKLSTAGRNAKN